MAVPIERVGRKARHEAVDDPLREQQLVEQDRVQAAVESRFYGAGILPQSDCVARFGVDFLIGVGNVPGDELRQRAGVVPGRRGGIHEGVEPEVFADFTGADGVLFIGEAILHGVGGVRACGAEQLHALLFFETGQIVNGLFAEDETGQQKDCQQQADERKQSDTCDFEEFFHGRRLCPLQR